MKITIKLLISFIAFTCVYGVASTNAQDKTSEVKFRNSYYDTRRAAHEKDTTLSESVVFIGNSITEQGWWSLLLGRDDIANRGIGGDNTFGMIDRLPGILETKPTKIFLMAGINDLTAGYSPDTILHNIITMVEMTNAKVPDCRFYIQSVLPLNDDVLAYPALKGKNKSIKELNARLMEYCTAQKAVYVDVSALVSGPDGELREELTKDGIHLHPEAYVIWAEYLKNNGYLN